MATILIISIFVFEAGSVFSTFSLKQCSALTELYMVTKTREPNGGATWALPV